MFTGLVEEIGLVQSVIKSEKGAQIRIKANKIISDLKIGDSICTNGVCLTVTSFNNNQFSVDVMAETMRKSNLQDVNTGDIVNLERALRLGDRFGGHIVSGHIDGTGSIESFEREDNAIWITVKADNELLKYIVHKGSIAIDGVSLTIAYVDNKCFKVAIIPHTKEETTLLKKNVNDRVNLECDVIGKYVEKLFWHKEIESTNNKIDMEFLGRYGFL